MVFQIKLTLGGGTIKSRQKGVKKRAVRLSKSEKWNTFQFNEYEGKITTPREAPSERTLKNENVNNLNIYLQIYELRDT